MNAPSRSTVWIRLQGELERSLPEFLKVRRWFGGKTRTIQAVEIADVVPIPLPAVVTAILVARVNYAEGPAETYTLPLMAESGPGPSRPLPGDPQIRICDAEDRDNVISDALLNRPLLTYLLDAIGDGRRFPGRAGDLVAIRTRSFEPLRVAAEGKLEPSPMKVEQSNSSVLYGRAFVMKFFRHLESGINPDFEVGQFLSERAGFHNIPPMAGGFEYRDRNGNAATMAILQGFVANRGDAWEHTLGALSEYYDRVAGASVESPELLGSYRAEANLLGRRTAELHRALASDRTDPAFAPELVSSRGQRELCDSMANLTRETFEMLRWRAPQCRDDLRERVNAVIGLETQVADRFRALTDRKLTGELTRIHGDLHLGQVLFTGDDFIFIDFEGEPARSLAERREKHSPLRDVAGMVRSFHYAACAALFRRLGEAGAAESSSLIPFANAWYRAASDEYLRSYVETAAGSDFLPTASGEFQLALNFWLLAKAVYELKYELNHRLDWVAIPVEGIAMLIRGPAAS